MFPRARDKIKHKITQKYGFRKKRKGDGGMLEQGDDKLPGEKRCVCTSSNGYENQQAKLQGE